MPLDTALIGALHVEYLKSRDLGGGGERPHHTLFQTSTGDALLEGKYDGDVSFADVLGRAVVGERTLEALDPELLALGRAFFQATADGGEHAIGKHARKP